VQGESEEGSCLRGWFRGGVLTSRLLKEVGAGPRQCAGRGGLYKAEGRESKSVFCWFKDRRKEPAGCVGE